MSKNLLNRKAIDIFIEGTPSHIIEKLSGEIGDALRKANIPPTGLHVLAMFHVALSCIQNVMEKGDEVASLGKMPSFSLILNLITRGMMDPAAEWPEETRKVFGAEFMEIVESLGGIKLDTPTHQSGSLFMAPASKEVH